MFRGRFIVIIFRVVYYIFVENVWFVVLIIYVMIVIVVIVIIVWVFIFYEIFRIVDVVFGVI